MDIKIEGLNGQLPNLDLFTLVNKICMKEGLHTTFKNRRNLNVNNFVYRYWRHSLTTMFHMIMTQSTGIPNGNHGLFLRYGIQAVTMHGFQRVNVRGNQIGFFSLGKILEGVFRSLNNLLERFHQSYFFYLLPSNDKFLSIAYFTPILCALVGALLVKSLVQWYTIVVNPITIIDEPEDDTKILDAPVDEGAVNDIYKILFLYIFAHIFGVTLMHSGPLISKYGAEHGYSTDYSIFYGFVIVSIISTFLPLVLTLKNTCSVIALNLIMLWEIALAILGIGMVNISLGIICGFVYVPFFLLTSVTSSRIRTKLNYILWILVHPVILLTIIVMLYTWCMFPDSSFSEFLLRGFSATRQAIVFGIVDSEIYGNWVFNVACCVFLPSWLCMSCVIMSCPVVDIEKKNETKKQKIE